MIVTSLYVPIVGGAIDRGALSDALLEGGVDDAVTVTVDREDALGAVERLEADALVIGPDVGDADDLRASVHDRYAELEIVDLAGSRDPGQDGSGALDYRELADRVTDAIRTVGSGGDGLDHDGVARMAGDLLRQSSDILAILERNGEIRYISRAIEELSDHDARAMRGDIALEYIHPDDRERVATEFFGDPVQWDGEQRRDTFRFSTGEDEYRIVESIARSKMSDPKIEGVVLNSRDVTERERRKAELERYETIVEAVPDPVYAVGDDGSVEFANEAFREVFGYAPDELRGEHISTVMQEEGVERARQHIQDLLADPDRGTVSFERRGETRDGEALHLEDNMTLLPTGEDGQFRGTAGVLRDVTDRVERERELERYETIVETVPVGIVVVGGEWGAPIEWVDDRFVSQIDKTREEVLDSTVLELIEEGYFEWDMAEAYEEGVRAMLSSDSESDRLIEDVVYHDPSGRDRYFNVHWGLRPMEDGEFRGTVCVFQEVTQRKEYERELERTNERLEQFASFVSHDLRNPINVAKGYVTQARDRSDADGPIDEIERSLDRMEQLIEELLTMARDGHEVDELHPIDLETAVRDAWSTVDTRDATYEVRDNPTLLADPGLLRNVFENLVRNAVEHGGESVDVEVGCLRDGDDLEGFYVEDDGPGIPDGDKETVFDLGYTTNADGTGFGLGIVDQIGRAHGWSVTVTDGDEGGARFEFRGVFEAQAGGDGATTDAVEGY